MNRMFTTKSEISPAGRFTYVKDSNGSLLEVDDIDNAYLLCDLLKSSSIFALLRDNQGDTVVSIRKALRGEFNQKIVANKVCGPLRKSDFEKNTLQLGALLLDISRCVISDKKKRVRIQPCESIDDLVTQLQRFIYAQQ